MSKGRLWTEEQFNCPVCLDLPTEPVTIPCGHSYCIACITDYWDSERKKTGSCSCPECRQKFEPRPQLCRNTMLAEAVEQLRLGNLSSTARESIRNARRAADTASQRGTSVRRAGAKQLPASSVPCDRCIEPTAAVKTCLTCMASFCESHLKPHQTQAKLKSHELIVPTGDLTQKICPEHKYLQEFYCRSCQIFICWLCTSNQHKEHDSVSAQAERTEKQKTLLVVQTENLQKLQEREKELKDTKKVLGTLKRMADLIHQVMTPGQEKISEAPQTISVFVLRIHELGSFTVNLDSSFDPVRNSLWKSGKMFNTKSYTVTERQSGQKPTFKLFSGIGGKTPSSRTQGPPPLPSVSARGPANNRRVSSLRSSERQREQEREREIQTSPRSESRRSRSANDNEADTWSVRSSRQPVQARENQEQADTWSLSSVRSRGRPRPEERETANADVQSSPMTQQKTPARQQPERQYAFELNFDPNTAHRRLVLSEDNTKATLNTATQPYPDVTERFDSWTQLLSLQQLSSARCYWEVEWRGRGSSVGVASTSMPRKGADAKARLGYNDQSWSLEASWPLFAALASEVVGVGLNFAMGNCSALQTALKSAHLVHIITYPFV
ncbi:E3 ubiquitin/ISG15 ligase TRIM25 [Bagarius yarrelli]|uniref:E3 ubiquitin/ISG15 ligase TRIM25 n=1 Tax=Bagarius yarrelli TaxID=175774 RepID=A0A556TR57_BAGYA|nr:E3 ubiquitin/ISG15 ligase TRIM25 [Bagarius yarrelli]